MFTASDARALQESYHKVKEELEKIGEFIKVAIHENAAVSQFFFFFGSGQMCQGLPKLDPVQKTLQAALEDNGYKVKHEWHGDPYVPRGLQDDYDSTAGPQYDNHGFMISWSK